MREDDDAFEPATGDLFRCAGGDGDDRGVGEELVGAEGAEGRRKRVRGLFFRLADDGEEEGRLGGFVVGRGGEGRRERVRDEIVVGDGGFAKGQGARPEERERPKSADD